MMLEKRLDYGFNGYQMPPIPRAARSTRRRSTIKRKVDVNQTCAFDLLANIAGKLSSESESSPGSMDISNKKLSKTANDFAEEEKQDKSKALNVNGSNDGNSRSFIVSELVLGAPSLSGFSKEISCGQKDACSGPASVITTSECSEKAGSAEPLVDGETTRLGSTTGKVDIELFGCRVSPGCKVESKSNKPTEVEHNDLKLAISKREKDECQMTLDRKTFGLGRCHNSEKLSSSRDLIPSGLLRCSRDNFSLVSRDDDEKSARCSQPSTKNKAWRPSPQVRDRRIRKVLASKYWAATPNKNEDELLSSDAERKYMSHNTKNGSKQLRSQKDYPFKKRKLYGRSLVSNNDSGVSSDETCKSPGRGFDAYASASMFPRVSGKSISAAHEHAPLQSKNSHVKLKIESFRVPEFIIEIPESETVGSLKKTVTEAVTAILKGGLHVGILLQGKKIRDDNKTLIQSGISYNNKLDTLGFVLEPNTSPNTQLLNPGHQPLLLASDAPQPLSRYPPMPLGSCNTALQGTSDSQLVSSGTNMSNVIESDHDSASSPPDKSLGSSTIDARGLVAVPAMSVEALSVVPMQKSKRSETAQRRIRRPFSVSEVEALVQAIEKLGTGRWRDIKLRAFENAKHRTYVDLKDKWKTLVHTARISPQQRRGEPVPQELLDRVLAAHAYWSQQQVKQQFKPKSNACRPF